MPCSMVHSRTFRKKLKLSRSVQRCIIFTLLKLCETPCVIEVGNVKRIFNLIHCQLGCLFTDGILQYMCIESTVRVTKEIEMICR
jgi:hypothetical protein